MAASGSLASLACERSAAVEPAALRVRVCGRDVLAGASFARQGEGPRIRAARKSRHAPHHNPPTSLPHHVGPRVGLVTALTYVSRGLRNHARQCQRHLILKGRGLHTRRLSSEALRLQSEDVAVFEVKHRMSIPWSNACTETNVGFPERDFAHVEDTTRSKVAPDSATLFMRLYPRGSVEAPRRQTAERRM